MMQLNFGCPVFISSWSILEREVRLIPISFSSAKGEAHATRAARNFLNSAKGAARPAKWIGNCPAPHSVLRVFLKRVFMAGFMIANCAGLSTRAMATPIVSMPVTSVSSPQPLGTTVTITASATDIDPGVISYRFEIGPTDKSKLSMKRDYSVDPTFVYTPVQNVGDYQFVVFAKNNSTGNIGVNSIPVFSFTSLVTGNTAVVTPTANPLVALFSSPPCEAGETYMRVSVLRSGATYPNYTNWVACEAGRTMNFLIAGMRTASQYTMSSETWNGTKTTVGPALPFKTGIPTITFPNLTEPVAFTSQDSQTENFLLLAYTLEPPVAIDLGGHPVWYYLDPSGTPPLVTRPVNGGTILMLANGANSAGTSATREQILREIDLGGNIIRETNATRISEQVSAMSGIASNCSLGGTDCLCSAFTHEAIRLPNGHTLALTIEEKIFTDGTQGSSPANPVDIMGSIIIDLDTNWQVAGYWRAFDYLNPNRAAILGETCTNGQVGCPPIFLTEGVAQDWLHGNSLFFTPSDGSVLFSVRHQDWIVKIDYGNGTGTNDIVWTLGLGGDFSIDSTNPYPWFSHQHDPGFVQGGTTIMAMFDNGNTRVAPPPLGLGSGDSRGYVLNVNQTTMKATPVMLADLGFFAEALGSAQMLPNGDYSFEAGYGAGRPPYSEAIEVFPNATLSFTIKTTVYKCYRSFRMTSLYIAPEED